MTLREAAQQALEALTLLQGDIEWTSNSPTLKFVNSTAAALRAALAEPEQKPQHDYRTRYDRPCYKCSSLYCPGNCADPYAALAEPAEPVAWVCPDDPERETAFAWKAGHCDDCGKQRIPLYTAPTPRKPLRTVTYVCPACNFSLERLE